MLAQKAQPRLAGGIIASVILALLAHRGTIFHRLRWAVLGAGTVWFDAKDIQSVASNYMGSVLHRRGSEHGGWQALGGTQAPGAQNEHLKIEAYRRK